MYFKKTVNLNYAKLLPSINNFEGLKFVSQF